MYRYTELPLAAQTAFSQLAEATLVADHLRSIADLPGSFTSKPVKGHKYWYYQYYDAAGKNRQFFVGPDNDAVRALIERKGKPGARTALAPLVRSAEALGCVQIQNRHFKVLKRLAEYGFFESGGVLVGTHAFLAYSNHLGLRFSAGSADHTHDIDFAHAGKNMSLALKPDFKVDVHEAIASLEMGFLPVSGMSGNAGATYLNPKEPEFRLDFLTTLIREGDEPYVHPDLGVTLQPLKFMEFSLENIQQTTLISGEEALTVNVPHPARYAMHKLIIAGERTGTFQQKTSKDLIQAGILLSFYKERRPHEAEEIWKDLVSRGKGWASRARQGLKQLDRLFPDLEADKWLDGAQHAKADKASPPVAYYGRIRADEDAADFIRSQGAKIGPFDPQSGSFVARVSQAAYEKLKQFPADFDLDLYARKEGKEGDLRDWPDADLLAEKAYLQYLVDVVGERAGADQNWKASLAEVEEHLRARKLSGAAPSNTNDREGQPEP